MLIGEEIEASLGIDSDIAGKAQAHRRRDVALLESQISTAGDSPDVSRRLVDKSHPPVAVVRDVEARGRNCDVTW